jgi:hypothetical protein
MNAYNLYIFHVIIENNNDGIIIIKYEIRVSAT